MGVGNPHYNKPPSAANISSWQLIQKFLTVIERIIPLNLFPRGKMELWISESPPQEALYPLNHRLNMIAYGIWDYPKRFRSWTFTALPQSKLMHTVGNRIRNSDRILTIFRTTAFFLEFHVARTSMERKQFTALLNDVEYPMV